MKRFLLIFLAAAAAVFLFACGKKDDTESSSTPQSSTPQSSTPTEPKPEEKAKMGLSLWAENGAFFSAEEEEEGTASVKLFAAAVVLRPDGRLESCRIDEAECKASFDKAGVLGELPESFSTKMQLGSDYGMKAASGIDKEWNEQVAFLEEHLNGKSLEEVKSIAVDDSGYPTDEALTAGCTVKVDGYLRGVAAAMEAAEELTGDPTDELTLGVTVKVKDSYDASEDGDGRAAFSLTAAAVTMGKNGKIADCKVDELEAGFTVTMEGVPTESEGETRSKKALGDSYGMKAASGIGKEWYEQAKGFEEYAKNKTPFEVSTIAADEESYPVDADLSAVCTIKIGDFKEAFADAVGTGEEKIESSEESE